MKRGNTLYTRKRDKKLKGHDKSGRAKRRTMYFAPLDVPGGFIPENQKSLIRKVRAFSTPKAARTAWRRKYVELGYTVGPGNVMLPPEGSDLPAIMIPKISSIANTYRSKNGKARRAMSPYDGGGFIL